jgi:hypothetical protein
VYFKADRIAEDTRKAMRCPGLNLVVWAVVNRLLKHVPSVIHEKMIGLISAQ